MIQPDTFTSDAVEINAAVASLEFLAVTKEDNLDLTHTRITIKRNTGLKGADFRRGRMYSVTMNNSRANYEGLEKILVTYGVMEFLDDKVEWQICTHWSNGKLLNQKELSPNRMISRITLSQILELLKADHPSSLTRADLIERELEKARVRVQELETLFSQEFKSLRASIPIQ